MSPRSATVELPKLKRARGGWVLYGPNEDSICPWHQFCAYSGDEKGVCPQCHSRYDRDGICRHMELPPGRTAPCLCARCGELFTAVTGFNMHFRRNGKCGDPEKRGLILVKQRGWQLWAKPGSRPEGV